MSFTVEMPVRFAHVDAAGIVFYPRYFEMLNAAVEEFFAIWVAVDFATLHGARRLGVPTVKLESEFVAPGRLGEVLAFELTVIKVGRSSCDLRFVVRCGGHERLRAAVVLVCMDLDRAAAVPWPEDIRAGLLRDDMTRVAVPA